MLWIAFVLVHVIVAGAGWVLPNQPMGDVYFVYEPWSEQAISGHGIVGITEDWIYPQVALVPMVLTQGFAWIAGYTIGWALFATACNALGFAVLVGRARSRGRVTAAWFWLAFLLLLGPVGLYRLDSITVPLAVAGGLWLAGRPAIASLLLTLGTWIKVWPAALIGAALIALRRRLTVLTVALSTSAVILVVVVAAGGAAHALSFVSGQTGRGLQVEAPVSAYYLWRAVFDIPGSFVYYDRDLLTFQVTGPEVDAVIAVMTPLLIVAVAAIAGLGALKTWRGGSFARVFPPLSLALVLAMIVFNKVGSPQYLTWLIAPVVMGLVLQRERWGGIALAGMGAALLTFFVYPLAYSGVIRADAFAATVLTARNALLVVILVWACVLLARVPARHPVSSPDPTRSSGGSS